MRRESKCIFLFVCFCLLAFLGKAQTNDLGARLKETLAGKAATVGVAVIFNGNELVTVNKYVPVSDDEYFQISSSLVGAGLPQ